MWFPQSTVQVFFTMHTVDCVGLYTQCKFDMFEKWGWVLSSNTQSKFDAYSQVLICSYVGSLLSRINSLSFKVCAQSRFGWSSTQHSPQDKVYTVSSVIYRYVYMCLCSNDAQVTNKWCVKICDKTNPMMGCLPWWCTVWWWGYKMMMHLYTLWWYRDGWW